MSIRKGLSMGIVIDKERLIFGLQTQYTTYAFAVDENGLIRHLYWGNKIAQLADLEVLPLTELSSNDPVLDMVKEEYPVFGGMRYKEQCLKVHYADGTRDIVYNYMGYQVNGEELTIKLKDEFYAFEIHLTYQVFPEQDLIERSTTVVNRMDQALEIESIYSGQLHIPYEQLTLTSTYGHWLAEFQELKQPLGQGKVVLESRRGISTHHHNPFFVLDHQGTETNGEIYFGALKWSGNFKTVIEPRPYGGTLVQMGLNPYDCQITLAPNESFTTPAMILGYTNQGFESMSLKMHDYARRYVLSPEIRPVLYNSWEATLFDVNCDEQIELAKKAQKMGIELFVVDDGWFGNRHSDADGLGDWDVNPNKFPEGLNPLIKAVKDLGMAFGIWIEPEMVNPPTQLLKEHPHWIYHFENRKNDTSRNQMVLNLTLPEVQTFIYEMIDRLLSEHEIDYLKWDANRPISQTGVSRDLWIRHIKAIYEIVDQIKKKHPNVLIEACASGGGRVDYGSLSVFDDVWTSDNTDAIDRLTIQKTFSYVYPIKAMRAWVTDNHYRSQIPLPFKFHSAMMGTLGMGCNILEFTEAEIDVSKAMIEQYKEVRHIIQDGDFYRLNPISQNNYDCFEYVYEHEVLVFAFLTQSNISRSSALIKLRGLNPEVAYTYVLADQEVTKTGAYLMNHGLTIHLESAYDSMLIYLSSDISSASIRN